MTYSNQLKQVVSKNKKKMVKTKNTVSTHKPLNLNCSLTEKSLMCGRELKDYREKLMEAEVTDKAIESIKEVTGWEEQNL